MAKRQSTTSVKNPSNSSSKRDSSAANKGGQTSAKKPTAKTPPPFSSEQIGQVAGQLWHLLEKQPGQSLADVKKEIDATADLVLAAVGWLAREDKLDFTNSGRSIKISLR